MAISIPLTGLAANDPVPGNYIEVNFAQGPASAGQTDYPILLMGNMLSTGSADEDGYAVYGPDTLVQLNSEADAVVLFGQGSELHRMYKRAVKVNQSTAIYAIVVPESLGSQASGTIAISTNANANATLRVWVQDEFVDVGVVSGDTPTTQASAVAAAINAMGDWAVTASPSSGNVTVTAKQKGLRGNFIRISARYLQASGSTVTPASQTALSGGTTADSNVAALAAISSQRFYNIVSAAEDATQFGALVTQIGTMAAPIVGLRQRAFAGSVDTLGNATTFATGINSARAEIIWQQNSDLTPGELAAHCAAGYALFEAPAVPRLNFSGFGNDAVTQPFWQIKAPLAGTVPTRTQIKSALNNGLTPIGVGRSGSTFLVKRITSRSLSGSVNDYRIRDAHKVTVCDRYADDLVAKAALQFSGKLIGNDPLPGQRVPGSNVVTPRVFKAMVDRLTQDYAENDLLENEETIKSNTVVVREASPTTRMSARVPLDIADILDQTATAVDQVG